jgi:hypothetical protein
MFHERKSYYYQLEELRGSKLLVYVTGDKPGMEARMHPEVLDKFVRHLDSFNSPKKITMFLHSRGGDTSAGWSIANLIRAYCEDFEVVIPMRAHSAATLLSLGANRIVMTKQATLGPIDQTVTTPLNPLIPNAGPNAWYGVSVEAIKGFVRLAKEEFTVKESHDMAQVLSVLSGHVHPLVLGEVFRARDHIRMLAKNLLERQLKGAKRRQIERIVQFLCSDSGSHSYTIDRTEARSRLGLNIVDPDQTLYTVISKMYDDIAQELTLGEQFNPPAIVGAEPAAAYSYRRALIESLTGGTDVFVSEGTISKNSQMTPVGVVIPIFQDTRTFEGWRRERA